MSTALFWFRGDFRLAPRAAGIGAASGQAALPVEPRRPIRPATLRGQPRIAGCDTEALAGHDRIEARRSAL